jgi:hypothetical protein
MSQSEASREPFFGVAQDDPATRETDDGRVLDPDANDALVDSADADRLATGAYDDDDDNDDDDGDWEDDV